MVAVSTTAWPAAIARIAFAEQFEELADLQRGLGRLRAAVDSRPEGIVLFVGHFRIDQRAGLDALAGVAMPTSRSAAVRRGLAESARWSAVPSVRVCACAPLVSQGLTSKAVAHAMRVADLENMKLPEERRSLGACARLLRSDQDLWWRRIDGRNEAGAVGGRLAKPAAAWIRSPRTRATASAPKTEKQPWQWCSPPAAFAGRPVFSEVDIAITSWPPGLVTFDFAEPVERADEHVHHHNDYCHDSTQCARARCGMRNLPKSIS